MCLLLALLCHSAEETVKSSALLGKFIFSHRTRFKDTSGKAEAGDVYSFSWTIWRVLERSISVKNKRLSVQWKLELHGEEKFSILCPS